MLGMFTILIATGCDHSSRDHAPPESPIENQASNPNRTSLNVGMKSASPIQFVNDAEAHGVNFTYRNSEEQLVYSMLETLGGGVGLLDYDLNGWPDIFLTGGGRFEADRLPGLPSALFRNLGQGEFEDVSSITQIQDSRFYSHGIAAGDYNSDGFPDVLITGFGGLQLFTNLGDGTFQRATNEAGLRDESWSVSAVWGDLTGDGLPDLYVVRYLNWSLEHNPICQQGEQHQLVCAPTDFKGLSDSLYRNNGDGTFEEITDSCGLLPGGNGLGAIIADLDLDSDLDLYVTNDSVANFCYRNSGSGQFEEIGVLSGTAFNHLGRPDGSMGVALGDFNVDGLCDIGVTNYLLESFALYRNSGEMNFIHVSQLTGLSAAGGSYVGWGTAFWDFDHDGDEDLFMVNGHVSNTYTDAPLRQHPLVYENIQGRKFQNVAPRAGEFTESPHRSRGFAKGDLDRDGREDIVISNCNEPVTLLMNRTDTNDRHWLGLQLKGTHSDRYGIGAVVTLLSDNHQQVRHLYGGSYASTHEPTIVFGLGETNLPQSVSIRWPYGSTQVVENLAPDRYHLIVEQRSE